MRTYTVPASATTSIVLLAVALEMAFLAAAFAAGEATKLSNAARAAALVVSPTATADLLPENWPRIRYDFGSLKGEEQWPRKDSVKQRSSLL